MLGTGHHFAQIVELFLWQNIRAFARDNSREPDDRIQRSTQFMGHIGQKIRLVLVRGFEVVIKPAEPQSHAVGAFGQVAKFIPISNLCPCGEIATCNSAQCRANTLDREYDRRRNQISKGQRKNDRQSGGAEHQLP